MPTTADHTSTANEKSSATQPVAHRKSPSRRSQSTINGIAVVEGFGFWSGKDVRLQFRPAPENTGIVFVRSDLPTRVRIPATVGFRVETPRRTTLSAGGVTVEMVEHIMAALAGLEIDNCEVWTDQSEMPGCDGSSVRFVEALDSVGIAQLDAVRQLLVINEVTRLGDEEYWIEARPSKTGRTTMRYRLDYSQSSTAIGRQTLELPINPQVFRQQVATSRTFMLEEEAKWLLAQGLGKRVAHQDVLVFNDEGPIDNETRFDDECVRHKILDLIGDLSLAGCDLVGDFVAHRSGHRLNAELVKVLLQEGQIRTE